MRPVWIIDDDKSIRWVIEKSLSREGIVFRSFVAAQDALDALEHSSPQVVISDIRMPGASGLEFMQQLKVKLPTTPVIIMTAYSDLESAVAAFQGGAFEYLPKPFDVDHAVELIRRALDESMRESSVDDVNGDVPEILGTAPTMQEVFRAIGRLSQSHATVLITGESGTGKELVALALHRHSPRAAKPFIAINTAAIPKDLLESELFGHERGAFTGAATMRRGRFEQADGGTLFLDEIGDMPPDLQTRLLRVLSDGQFYRVGGHTPMTANVRVIAATHQDLGTLVADGRFRADLLHRLDVVRLRLPPLRERRDDVPKLAERFLATAAAKFHAPAKRLAPPALERLLMHHWPGNVRELENLCWRLAALTPGDTNGPADLDEALGAVGIASTVAVADSDWDTHLAAWVRAQLALGTAGLHAQARERFDRALLQAALDHTGGRRSEAASKLGLGRNTLTRKLGPGRKRS